MPAISEAYDEQVAHYRALFGKDTTAGVLRTVLTDLRLKP